MSHVEMQLSGAAIAEANALRDRAAREAEQRVEATRQELGASMLSGAEVQLS